MRKSPSSNSSPRRHKSLYPLQKIDSSLLQSYPLLFRAVTPRTTVTQEFIRKKIRVITTNLYAHYTKIYSHRSLDNYFPFRAQFEAIITQERSSEKDATNFFTRVKWSTAQLSTKKNSASKRQKNSIQLHTLTVTANRLRDYRLFNWIPYSNNNPLTQHPLRLIKPFQLPTLYHWFSLDGIQGVPTILLEIWHNIKNKVWTSLKVWKSTGYTRHEKIYKDFEKSNLILSSRLMKLQLFLNTTTTKMVKVTKFVISVGYFTDRLQRFKRYFVKCINKIKVFYFLYFNVSDGNFPF